MDGQEWPKNPRNLSLLSTFQIARGRQVSMTKGKVMQILGPREQLLMVQQNAGETRNAEGWTTCNSLTNLTSLLYAELWCRQKNLCVLWTYLKQDFKVHQNTSNPKRKKKKNSSIFNFLCRNQQRMDGQEWPQNPRNLALHLSNCKGR